ncbi:hypothetical protein N7535_008235 [Penicillium sp. DV-2018c]|nr:hypothetical protein N7461_004273 [Penicillium sp. DV-2018c]KAJ5566597.1 hypothetical protein N7535_008235 [Penicillium sp. DV-2018c]
MLKPCVPAQSRAKPRRQTSHKLLWLRDRHKLDSTAMSTEAEKDPYTLEREARNKERLEREKQHREKTKSGRRRDSRQDRVVGGRRIHYKYEDEL